MKKLLGTITLLFVGASMYAQSVAQGTDIIGVGLRLGIYNTVATDKGNNNAQNSGRAGDIIYPFSFDRGINDNITIGGQFRYNAFIIGKDTTGKQVNQAYSMDFDIDGAYHFVRSEHTDLYIQAMLGYSYLNFANTNLNYQGVFSASGFSYGIELGARFYIGDHLGILLNFAFAGDDYPNGTVTAAGGATDHFSISFTGTTYGTGLCYKF